MIKFLIISFVIIFIIARFFGRILSIIRLLAGEEPRASKTSARKQHFRYGDVDIQVSDKEAQRHSNFKGGEYIDFEEVSDDEPKNDK